MRYSKCCYTKRMIYYLAKENKTIIKGNKSKLIICYATQIRHA